MNPNCPRCAASGAIKNGRFRIGKNVGVLID